MCSCLRAIRVLESISVLESNTVGQVILATKKKSPITRKLAKSANIIWSPSFLCYCNDIIRLLDYYQSIRYPGTQAILISKRKSR